MTTYHVCSSEFVRWVSESLRPFAVVRDRGFIDLMKTGRPYAYWVPSPQTVRDDVVTVWHACRHRIIEILEVDRKSVV